MGVTCNLYLWSRKMGKKSMVELMEEFENMQVGRRAMKEIKLVDRVLDDLEMGNFIGVRDHLNRDDLGSYMIVCDYNMGEMTNEENSGVLPSVYDHLQTCPDCYELVKQACVRIKYGIYCNRIEEDLRN